MDLGPICYGHAGIRDTLKHHVSLCACFCRSLCLGVSFALVSQVPVGDSTISFVIEFT
jgi:hypothetical protein